MIKSTPFGVVRLTGEDAKKFIRQVRFGRPSKSAKESLREGRKLLAEMESKALIETIVSPTKEK